MSLIALLDLEGKKKFLDPIGDLNAILHCPSYNVVSTLTSLFLRTSDIYNS
jgi:hypothetical protein